MRKTGRPIIRVWTFQKPEKNQIVVLAPILRMVSGQRRLYKRASAILRPSSIRSPRRHGLLVLMATATSSIRYGSATPALLRDKDRAGAGRKRFIRTTARNLSRSGNRVWLLGRWSTRRRGFAVAMGRTDGSLFAPIH